MAFLEALHALNASLDPAATDIPRYLGQAPSLHLGKLQQLGEMPGLDVEVIS